MKPDESKVASEIRHIGIVVKDIDKAVEYYSKLGLEPFNIRVREPGPGTLGKDYQKLRFAFVSMIGSIKLELIQVVEGQGAFDKTLDAQGESLHHIALVVDGDLNHFDAEILRWTSQGFKIGDHGSGWAYIDFGYNVIIEFISSSLIEVRTRAEKTSK